MSTGTANSDPHVHLVTGLRVGVKSNSLNRELELLEFGLQYGTLGPLALVRNPRERLARFLVPHVLSNQGRQGASRYPFSVVDIAAVIKDLSGLQINVVQIGDSPVAATTVTHFNFHATKHLAPVHSRQICPLRGHLTN